jgi:hypothetical protein
MLSKRLAEPQIRDALAPGIQRSRSRSFPIMLFFPKHGVSIYCNGVTTSPGCGSLRRNCAIALVCVDISIQRTNMAHSVSVSYVASVSATLLIILGCTSTPTCSLSPNQNLSPPLHRITWTPYFGIRTRSLSSPISLVKSLQS